MRKIYVLALMCAMLGVSAVANAQSVVVNKADGNKIVLPSKKVNSITTSTSGDAEDLDYYTKVEADSLHAEMKGNSKAEIDALKEKNAELQAQIQTLSSLLATLQADVDKLKKGTDTHGYVDLGLPSGTLWATCNIGAENPKDFGDYFAWGETTPQSDSTYSWAGYKWMTSGQSSWQYVTKYTFADGQTSGCWYSNGTYVGTTVDGVTYTDLRKLEPADDAATANWGSDWCMPTYAQQVELVNSSYTSTAWTTENGVYGRRITSLTNGNSIFLPAAGCRHNGTLWDLDSKGYYWSSELCSGYSYSAWELYFCSSGVYSGIYDHRYCGRSVRPVRSSTAK